MTAHRLIVLLNGARVGHVDRDSRDRLSFTYDRDWLAGGQPTPLSLSLPLTVRTHVDAPVSAFLWGLLPDNDRVLERWGRKFHVSPRNAFSLLRTPVGEDCPGAVQLVTEQRLASLMTVPSVEWLTEDDVAARLRDLARDTAAWLPTADAGQFSLAGAQAKTALHYDDQRMQWGLAGGAMPTTHILKPAIAGLDDHDLNEHLCLSAARKLGMPAVITRVERFVEMSAIVVKRYDRYRSADGQWMRIHQEDLCQALGVLPTAKYQNDGGPTPRQIVALLRDHVRPRARGEAEVRRFVDALALNWLIAGTDAHAKNYALLLAGPAVRLAPLYDVASVLPYDIDVLGQKLAMKIGGEYRLKALSLRNWYKLADELAVDESWLIERLRTLADDLPSAIADEVATAEVAELESPLPARLLDRVAARARRCRP